MTSIRLSRFADRVLSSTRISENSQLITDHSQGDRGHVPNDRHPHRRRRLRILDEEEQEFTFQTTVADENTDPSFLSNALPSSIPAPVTSSKLFSDDEDEEQVAKQGGKNNGKSKAMFSEEESDEDEEGIVPLSIRLRNEYDPRISVSERDRLAERSPSVTSVNSEPEEEILQPSDHPEDTIAPNDDVDVQALDRLRRLAKGASKRTVKRPRPKLDPERLLSDRGLPALLTECKRVKFKGRGYEFQDLDRLLFTYEAWANRLLPKSTFMEIIERLERVGSRREIQTALHRLRNGIWPPYLSAEHVHNSGSEDDDHAGGIREPVEIAESGGDEEAAWERALQAMPVQENNLQNEQPRPQCQSPGSDAPSDSFSDLDDVYHPRPSVFNLNESVDKLSETHIPGPSSAVDTTDESRAERNRRLALERLEAKRRSSTQSQTSGSQFKPGGKSILKSALKAAVQNQPTSATPSTMELTAADESQLLTSGTQCIDKSEPVQNLLDSSG